GSDYGGLMADQSREFDIIVFGATGFVGELTAEYLAQRAPAETRIALAGRSESKLRETRSRLPESAASWPLIVADADSPASLDAMVARARVIATTVGPYLKYGEALVGAAASGGTDYVDLTGEVPFIRFSIDKYDDVARATHARIVHACGFDSIPSDVGVYALFRKVQEDGEGTLTETTNVVTRIRGGASGGTVDSMRVISGLARDPETRKVLLNPQALSSGPGAMPEASRSSEPSDMPIRSAASVDPSLSGGLGPFFMSSFNTRVVRRTNFMLDGAYGDSFRYGEAMSFGKNRFVARVAAGAASGALGAFFAGMAFKPTRRVLDRFLPKPGEGPDAKARERGYFELQAFTRTTTGKRYRSVTAAQGDPGYKATAMMFGEAALTLALDRSDLPDRYGVLTPVSAMGDALVARLRAAGMTIEASALD
ncbi:MAG TPA: saccharopine dehydrogenase NADP-binding domain-containing protein, partial [Nocardioidaceae bacterium]|nr:saccharopine dehydrogenase NADP-binding domain-containing protein [Nocardioidaceae bacterium]